MLHNSHLFHMAQHGELKKRGIECKCRERLTIDLVLIVVFSSPRCLVEFTRLHEAER